MITMVEIIQELKESGVSFAFDFDKNEIRMYRDLVHERSLGENKYPNIEEKFYTKGSYPIGKDFELSLFQAMKYFAFEAGQMAKMYSHHMATNMGIKVDE